VTVRICAGKINDWLLIDREVGFVIVGTIEGDAYYRWPDGRFIQTSLLKPGQLVAAGELIRTINRVYLLGDPLQPTAIN